MSGQLEDEILSINSIYESNTLEQSNASTRTYTLRLPTKPDFTISIEFPIYYPEVPPIIIGTSSTGPNAVKGEGQDYINALRSVLGEVFVPGMPCIYDLLEDSAARFQQLESSAEEASGQQTLEAHGQRLDIVQEFTSNVSEQQAEDLGEAPAWIVSDVVTEKKSVFVARAVRVDSVQAAKQYLNHLLATDKKAARATHNITAWRIKGQNDVQYQDCDDDGETAAGGRLLHLLELMDVWNVMVIVTRWYGGVHLGSDRFRIINQVARDAVVKGQWKTEPNDKKRSKR